MTDKGLVLRALQTTPQNKSIGPDKVSGWVLKGCESQLCDISHYIFQIPYAFRKFLLCGGEKSDHCSYTKEN